MRLIGIDPGTATVGYGVVDLDDSYHAEMVACGVIQTSASLGMSERLAIIHSDMRELLDAYRPGIAVIEKLFAFRNVTTVISVSQARGVLMLAAHQAGCRIAEYTPMEVKLTITGYGKAQKVEVQEMVKDLLALSTLPRPDDAADALAFALTHARYLESQGIAVQEALS